MSAKTPSKAAAPPPGRQHLLTRHQIANRPSQRTVFRSFGLMMLAIFASNSTVNGTTGIPRPAAFQQRASRMRSKESPAVVVQQLHWRTVAVPGKRARRIEFEVGQMATARFPAQAHVQARGWSSQLGWISASFFVEQAHQFIVLPDGFRGSRRRFAR
jgi:hypothetical protein